MFVYFAIKPGWQQVLYLRERVLSFALSNVVSFHTLLAFNFVLPVVFFLIINLM